MEQHQGLIVITDVLLPVVSDIPPLFIAYSIPNPILSRPFSFSIHLSLSLSDRKGGVTADFCLF